MLQVLTTIFFSIAALGAIAMLSMMLLEGWPEVRRALGLASIATALPRPASPRIRRVRTAPVPVARPVLRAAA